MYHFLQEFFLLHYCHFYVLHTKALEIEMQFIMVKMPFPSSQRVNLTQPHNYNGKSQKVIESDA